MLRLFYALLLINNTLNAESIIQTILNGYKIYLDAGTYIGQDWSKQPVVPQSRYHTFLLAFEHFATHRGKVVVELGTSRSFTHGGLPGCNLDNPKYWTPADPQNWDWGAGFFTRMAAECLQHLKPIIHTVDIAASHIARCKIMTQEFASSIRYHICSSVDFLRECKSESIDLLYLDTGDMTPIEPTARLQLEEAQVIVQKNLLTPHGIILIDDVKNQTPKKFGETSNLGKSKYAIPYLLEHGFKIVADEYQVILKKNNSNVD